MDWEKATQIAYEIGKSRLAQRRIDLFRKAVDYARVRVDWQLSTPEERVRLHDTRRALHDAFIEECNRMSRNMCEEGEENSWREDLGDDRKDIGDFACYLHLILGLVAR